MIFLPSQFSRGHAQRLPEGSGGFVPSRLLRFVAGCSTYYVAGAGTLFFSSYAWELVLFELTPKALPIFEAFRGLHAMMRDFQTLKGSWMISSKHRGSASPTARY